MLLKRGDILDELKSRISAGGGTLVANLAAVAHEMGIKPNRLYYTLNAFEREGLIARKSKGPKGTEMRLVTSAATVSRSARARRTKDAVGKGPATGAQFCPWCGRKSEAGWRFCAACGEKLPQG